METKEPLSFEVAVANLRMEVEKFERGEDSGELPGESAFVAAVSALSLMENLPSNILTDYLTQASELKQVWRDAKSPEQQDTVRRQIKKGFEILMERLEKAKKS